MAINFPTSPTTNVTTHTHNNVTYLWDGVSWVAQGSTVSYTLPIATASDLGGVKIGDRLTIDASTGVLDADVQSGGGGGTTNLSNTATGSALTIESSSGNNTDLPAATTSAWGVMTDADKTNLDANTNKVTNATHTGDVTGATALTIADDKIEEKHINAGGTVGADKVLVYDAAEATNWKWATQSGSGGGSPGGSANYIQYNDGSGGFAGDSKLRINTGSVVQTLEFWDASATSVSSAAVGCYYEALAGNIPEKNELLFYGQRTASSSVALSVGADYAHLRFKLKDASSSLGTVGQVLTVGSNGNVKWDTAGGAGSGLQSRTTAAATTSSLADQASGNLDITNVAKSFALLKIQTSHAAWVTLYTDTTSRSNDSTRNITTDPLPGSGVIAEVLLSDGGVQKITPGLIGYNDDATPVTTVYAKVQNRSGSATTVTVTLHFVQIES